MKDVVLAFLLRYGAEDTLTEIARGFKQAADEWQFTHDKDTSAEKAKRVLIDIATELFTLRNKFRE